MKEQILKLRAEGKSFLEIKAQLGCSLSTISYHCSLGQKEKSKNRRILNRKKNSKWHLKDKIRSFQRRSGSKLLNKSENNFTVEELLKVFGEDPKCYLTGEKIDLYDCSSYHLDHIIPVEKGGTNRFSNLGILLKDINMMKSNLSIKELIENCKKILLNNGYEIRRVGE